MNKIWKILPFILIPTLSIGVTKNIEILSSFQHVGPQEKPFYKNVDQPFNSDSANRTGWGMWVNKTVVSDEVIIFNWKEYADSWDEFKSNYGNLNLQVDMAIGFNNWGNLWSNNSFSISLNDIASKDEWKELGQVDHYTDQSMRWDMTHGQIAYATWISGNSVFLRFRFYAWASNDYDCYYFTINTKHVTCNATFDYQTIYSKLNQGVNNKLLTLESDYTTSLQDERNIPIEKKAIDELIMTALGKYYETWKGFIADYAYSDQTNQASITVKFDDPNNNQPVRWDFKVSIKFKLSQEYWDKEFSKRLDILPGKVIDPNNPNGAMIEDIPLKWQGKDVYSTTASVRFAGTSDGSETMKVNGIPIHVIDNTFTFEMTDRQNKDEEGNLVNEYDILLEKHNLDNFDEIIGHHEVKYLIKQDVPNFDLKWYAWNPNSNPDQRKLVEPTLPNGDVNPNYDKEVNVKTGTKTQILWVKHQAQNPFPLDPLDKNGDVIKDNSYEEGFLAEGSVSGMGIAQLFNDDWIKSVQRVEVDPKTLQPIGTLEKIKSNTGGGYWSDTGTYLYVLTDQKNHTSNKFIMIGQKWQDKYVKFLDILDSNDIAVSFWSTLQGFHLKNYLATYKQLNSKDIQNLSFEQVSSYWKEYVSDVKSQHIGPGDKPDEKLDLKDRIFETIKMNKTTVEEIREEIKKQVIEQLSGTKLIYDVDYELKPIDDDSLRKLLDYDYKGNATMTLKINALDTSTLAIGSNYIKIINNINYDPDKVIDLKNIKFKVRRYNFRSLTVDQLKEWIFKDINQTFESYKISLHYPDDYDVKPLDEETLKQFLTNENCVSLKFTIYAQDESIKAKNSTTLELINDPDAPIVPPDPPGPDPEPTPIEPGEKMWGTRHKNLIIMSVVTVLIVGGIGTTIFLKYHFKKGIGVKKNKTKNSNKLLHQRIKSKK